MSSQITTILGQRFVLACEREALPKVATQQWLRVPGANGTQTDLSPGTTILPAPEMLLPRHAMTVFPPSMLRCAEGTQRKWMRVRRERGL